MMIAVPSASNTVMRLSVNVTRVVTPDKVPFAVVADAEVRQVAQVERVIGVRVGVAGRAGIEVAAGGGEVRLALADRVQVNAVQAWLEAGNREFDVDR